MGTKKKTIEKPLLPLPNVAFGGVRLVKGSLRRLHQVFSSVDSGGQKKLGCLVSKRVLSQGDKLCLAGRHMWKIGQFQDDDRYLDFERAVLGAES